MRNGQSRMQIYSHSDIIENSKSEFLLRILKETENAGKIVLSINLYLFVSIEMYKMRSDRNKSLIFICCNLYLQRCNH